MKPIKGWQEKQWCAEERPNIDLSSRLQSLQATRYPKLSLWKSGGLQILRISAMGMILLGIMIGLGRGISTSVSVPWHLQLFVHWLLQRGDIKTIPPSLYAELDGLCRRADYNGQVNGYKASPEILYGLGRFQCTPDENNTHWQIWDKYGFDSSQEALAGTQLAEFLIKLRGEDYTFNINAKIPQQSAR